MADRNNTSVTPEYLAQREAIARALLGNVPAEGRGWSGAIVGILNALAGHGGLAQVENIRRDQLGRVGESNVPSDRRVARPPPPGVDPNAGSTIMPRPRQSQAPTVTTPIPMPTTAPRPRTRPIRTAQPTRPIGAPASAPPDAVTTGATVPLQSGLGAVAPEGLTPERGDEIVRQALTAHDMPTYDPNQDIATFRSLTNDSSSEISPSTSFLVRKYGPELAAAVVTSNPGQPMSEIFHRHYRAGDPYTAFVESLPTSLERGRDPNSITVDQWLTAQDQMNTNLGITPSPSDGRMNLGGQDLAQSDSQTDPWQGQLAQAAGPTESQPSTPSEQPVANLPFSLPQSLPASEQIETLERQLSSDVYAMMSPEERKAITEEYRKLIAPQRIEVGDVSASYKYDPNTNSFVLDPQSVGRRFGQYQVGGETITGAPGPGNRVVIPEYGVSGQPGRSDTSRGQQGDIEPNPRRPQHPLFPGGRQTGNLPSDLEQYRQEQRITGETRSRSVANEDTALNAALESYDLSIPLRADLGFIRTLTEQSGPFSEGGMYRGPGADWVQSALRILKNFGVDIPATSVVPNAEGIRKVIVQLGSQATRQLSNRPANFEFQTILNAFPGLEVSYEGANLLLDYLDQVQQRMQETGQAAELYMQRPVDQRGGWRRIVGELDRTNPIMITVPAGNWLRNKYGIGGSIRLTTRKVTEAEERTLPADVYFFRNGELHHGDAPVEPRAPVQQRQLQ